MGPGADVPLQGFKSAVPLTRWVALDMRDPSLSLSFFRRKMGMVVPASQEHPRPCPSFKLYDPGPLPHPFHASVFLVVDEGGCILIHGEGGRLRHFNYQEPSPNVTGSQSMGPRPFCYFCVCNNSKTMNITNVPPHGRPLTQCLGGPWVPFPSWLCPLADPPQLGDSPVNIGTQRSQLATSELTSLGITG